MKARFFTFAAAAALCATAVRADDFMDKNSYADAFTQGGIIMYFILAASIIAVIFMVERLFVIRRGAQIPKKLMADLREALVSGGIPAGLEVVTDDRSAMGKVMCSLLSKSGATRRELENTVDDEASRILYDLRANLRPLGIIAQISPLLGLLGTVFGLIAAFRTAAELGMDDPRNFAAGIYEALYTTAFGLVVAIPCSLAYNILRNRADSIMREVEKRALAFISSASNRAARKSGVYEREEPAREEHYGSYAGDVQSPDPAGEIRADSEETSVTRI